MPLYNSTVHKSFNYIHLNVTKLVAPANLDRVVILVDLSGAKLLKKNRQSTVGKDAKKIKPDGPKCSFHLAHIGYSLPPTR